MRRVGRPSALVVSVIAALFVAGTTLAYFAVTGSGSSSASIGSLAAPSITSTTAGAGTMALGWSSVPSPTGVGTVSYYVTRDGGNPTGNCPTAASPAAVTSCTDSGLAAGTHTYTVTSTWQSWSTASATSSPSVAYGVLDHFAVAAVANATAGTPFSVAVTAKDVNNNTVANYVGTVHFTSSDGQAVLPSDYTFVSGDNGAHTFTNGMTLKTAGSKSVSVNDAAQTSVTGSSTVTVGSATASTLSLSAATASPTAGAADNLTVSALDPYGNTATGYTGSKNLTFSGAHLIGAYTPTVTSSLGSAVNFGTATSISFTNGVATVTGSNNGAMKLYKVESVNITVTDGSISNGTGTAVSVGPATAATFTIPTPSTQTAGAAFNVNLTAYDTYGNTATGYSGSQTITFSGPANSPNGTAPSYPATVSFSSGSGTASITLFRAASTTLTATQGTVTGSTGAFTVSPGGNAKIAASAGASQTAGSSFSVTLTAQDTWGNTPGTLSGNKSISVSGPSNSPNSTAPTYPASATFSGGTVTVPGFTLVDAETTTLTVTDTTDSYSGVASSSITVAGGANAKIYASAGASQTAGTAFAVTLTAKDIYGNAPGTLSGLKNLSFSGPANSPNSTAPTYPTSATFSGGTVSVNITLVDAQTTTLTVSDTTDSYAGVASASITVSAAAGHALAITPAGLTGPSSTKPWIGPFTVAESDTYGNASTTAETVTLSSSSAGGTFGTSQLGTASTTVSIPGGSSSTTFYYGDTTQPGTPTLTAAASGLTSGTRTTTITSPAGLEITSVAGTGTPALSGCTTVSASYTCTVTGTGKNGSITFKVQFANSSGTAMVYSASNSSSVTESGQNSGSASIGANATTSTTTLTASHTNFTTNTSTLTFGSYTLVVSVGA